MLNQFQELKKMQSFKKGPKIRWLPILTKNQSQYFIKWYAILKSALTLNVRGPSYLGLTRSIS